MTPAATPADSAGAANTAPGNVMIAFESVTKRYPGTETAAVTDLTLALEEGTFTSFVGPSGCGKTTAMRMINAMVTPTSGSVRVAGRDVADRDAVQLRRSIGYVIQSAGLMPHQRIIDNVATVPVLQGRSRRAARHAAAELLERVGLDPALGTRYPAQLSGGQQQRVGVARALAADPAVLLMDEPFSAVDPVVREGLQDEMLRLQRELAKTIVFVTHDIDEAVKLSDRIAVFGTGGRLLQYDAPERILAAPADERVADFVGRDRGYRLLQFDSGASVEIVELPTVDDSGLAELALPPGQWRLVVHDGRPFGWIDDAGLSAHRSGANLYDSCTAGGSLFPAHGTLRKALDAALSSPSGTGVVVDADGRVTGGVTTDAVLAAITAARSA